MRSMAPDFLHKVADQVIRLGVVQRVLQQSDSGSRKTVSVWSSLSRSECARSDCWGIDVLWVFFPLCVLKVLDEPLRLYRRIDDSTEMLSRLEERISVALLSNENAKRAARLEKLWAFEELRRKARDGLKPPEKGFVREKVRASCFRDNLCWCDVASCFFMQPWTWK